MNGLFALAALLGAGCETAGATGLPLPRERATECRVHCATLEMELSAVVIIMNHAGCVCQPRMATPAPAPTPPGAPAAPPAPTAQSGAAAAAGAAVIAAIAQEQQAQRTHH